MSGQSTKVVRVRIKGKTPLLMHRYPIEPIEAIEKKTKEEQAEISAYRLENGGLFVPGVCVQRSLVNGATYCKGKGRASLQKPAAACLMIYPENLPLGTETYVIDSRRVVNPSTKGAIVRHRPRLEEWELEFDLEYDPSLLSEQNVRDIVDNSCNRVGLLDFRPEKKGMFGRSFVTKWETNGTNSDN